MRSHFHRQNVPLVVLFAACLAAVMLFFVHEREKRQALRERSVQASAGPRDQQIQHFVLTGFDDRGKKFWDLEGGTARIDPDQTVYLDDNVTLRLRDNTLVKTSKVTWAQNSSLMTTNAPVVVNREATVIHGRGAIGRPNESFIQINRDIRMTLNASAHLTCQGPMKVYYKENKMVFFRKVRVKDSRGVLSANRMDVFMDEHKKVDKVIAIGNVVIERGTDTTHSQRAIYSLLTGAVRLEGSPEITLHKGGAGFLDSAAGN
ncbi:MAG: LPS export ABC transporter periplasmic protein LptC [Candidatus Omnitrophica bacterium]|nr:LPS export ABC transporter periplasmic protein LptC [Candidatus Omnitrophota bacterium]